MITQPMVISSRPTKSRIAEVEEQSDNTIPKAEIITPLYIEIIAIAAVVNLDSN